MASFKAEVVIHAGVGVRSESESGTTDSRFASEADLGSGMATGFTSVSEAGFVVAAGLPEVLNFLTLAQLTTFGSNSEGIFLELAGRAARDFGLLLGLGRTCSPNGVLRLWPRLLIAT